MALNLSITHPVKLVGDVNLTAYVKVIGVTGNKSLVQCDIKYLKDDADGETIKSGSFEFTPSMDGGNFIKQAYEHLKTLPEFASATDA